jgi:hypothetical protein
VQARPVKVLYIAGLGHSGSTLLGALLGQLDGFFYAGELTSTGRTLAEGSICGCGEPIAVCPTWRRILPAAFGEPDGFAGAARLEIDRSEGRARGVLRQVLRAHGLLPRSRELEEARAAFVALFGAIADTTGSRVVVDSSKWPGYALFLEQTEGIELAVVHLVRDPRGVVHSRLRSAERRGFSLTLPPAGFAVVWAVWNALIELVWRRRRYLQLRYEDFVARPEDAVRRIAALADEVPDQLPFVAADTALLPATHSVAGNRNRFQTGEVSIRPDDEWRSEPRLAVGERRAVAVLTWPVRLRYGYR